MSAAAAASSASTSVHAGLPSVLAEDPALANDDLIVSLYGIGQVWARTNRVTVTSVMRFIMTLMKAAERYVVKDGDGEHKTAAVMTVVRLIVQDKDIVKVSDEERKDILFIVNGVGEEFIRDLVQAVHDPMGTIGKISKGFQELSSCCWPKAQKKPK